MFESLKKKFSRTSKQLTDEIESEAKNEDNYIEEEPNKSSFFSFAKSKDKEDEEVSKDDSDVEESKSKFSLFSKSKDKEDEEVTNEDDSDVEESKSKFSLFTKSKNDEEVSEDDSDVEDSKSKFSLFNKSKDKEDEEVSEDDSDVEDSKSKFTLFNKSKNDEEVSEDDSDVEESKSKFSLFTKSKNEDETLTDEPLEEKKGFFSKPSKMFSFVREKKISEKHVEDILWELEMGLLESDVAMEVASKVVDSVKDNLVGQKIKRSSDIDEYTYNALQDAVREIIDVPGKNITEMIEEKKAQGQPLVIMFVGINGTGKTTTIAKLANFYIKKGYTPVMAASDTFRAGAIEQINFHAENLDVKLVKHQKGSDPAAVAYDAIEHAKAQGKELVFIDTAGRMQTNTNLMDEMKKIKRITNPDLIIFVGDALTGNDATEQASKFNNAIDIDGVILTKADADSKGGASLSIGYVIKKPIMFLGMGQGYDDIREYDSEWMLNQLFSFNEDDLDTS